jgi:chemotaxis protein histidine kinase CheA
LKEEMNSINKKQTNEHVAREEREESFKIDDQTLLDAVLGPTHSITAEYVTLRYSQKHPGHNALEQLVNRIKDYELTTNQHMSQLISEIEALEKLVLSQTQDKEAPSAAPSEVPDDSRELARLKGLICAMVDHLERRQEFRDGNAPGHSHRTPGVWDIDNGELAGKKCSWCELWQEALEIYRQKDQFYN